MTVAIFPPCQPHDFFCGMSSPNIPLSESVIKKGAQLTVLAPEIDFVQKTCFFQILGLFDPLKTNGGGSKFKKKIF